MFEGNSLISISSDPGTSESDSPSPSTSKNSEEFSTLGETTASQDVPVIVISNSEMPQVTHSIEEEENSSNEVITNSNETVTDSVDQEQVNTVPLMTNPGTHDLLTVSLDSTLGKPSQMEVPSFLSLSQKPNALASPYDSLVNAPVQAEVMYVSDTVRRDQCVVSKETSSSDKCQGGERSKPPEVLDTGIEATANDQSDPIAPFSITLSSSDSNMVSATNSQDSSSGAPPSEERISDEESAAREDGQTATTGSPAEVPDNNSELMQGDTSETEASSIESYDATLTHPDCQVSANGELELVEISENISSNQKAAFEAPQRHQLQRGKAISSSQRGKDICGSIPSELFDPPRKEIPEPGDYGQLYTCRMLDTATLASSYQSKNVYDNMQETNSLTSLASASTETIHSESFESLDADKEGLDERGTILKCITDNSFLEFLITEGLELDSSSKKDVVDVVLTQYSSRLSAVETTIPKLAEQITQTEATIGQQKERVKHLQEELEFVKGEIVENEDLLLKFSNEQQGLSKKRKALKRKVARCEGTMKHLLANAKKSRCD